MKAVTTQFQVPILSMDGDKVVHVIEIPALQDEDGEIYLDEQSRAVIEEYRSRHYGIISAKEIVQLREKLGLTQTSLARLLQLGEKTCSRWENNRERPSRSLNILLKALKDGHLTIPYLESLIPESEQKPKKPPTRRKALSPGRKRIAHPA